MSSRQPQPRQSHAAVAIGDFLYVWGGIGLGDSVQTSTVERFCVSSMKWEESQNLLASLPERWFGMAVASDGENSYIFAGETDSSVFTNTLYQVNPATGECREIVSANSPPPPKQASAMIYHDHRLVVYGGKTAQGKTDDLHVFDLRTRKWSAPPTTGDKPPKLANHTFTKVDDKRAVVYGYSTSDPYLLDLEKWYWTKLSVSGAKPPTRFDHATCCVTGPLTGQHHAVVMVVGGYAGRVLSDIWLLDLAKEEWREVILPVAIAPRWCHSATVFGRGETSRVVVLFGGSTVPEPTVLFLELQEGSWQVTKVVQPRDSGHLDEQLVEPVKKLELFSQEETGEWHQTQSTVTESMAGPTTHKGTSQLLVTIKPEDLKYSDERLGKGANGVVWKGTWKGMEVAIKKCNDPDPNDVKILQQLGSHPNIIAMYGVVKDERSSICTFVTELVRGGSMYDFIHENKNKPSNQQRYLWIMGITDGMLFLHDKGLAHRDLKSGNVLLAGDNLTTPKLCDFGTARPLDHTTEQSDIRGTYRWMAPEVRQEEHAQINQKCDVFSFSMLLCEIVTLELPYKEAETQYELIIALSAKQRPTLPESDAECPPFLRCLIKECWAEEPHERPSFQQIKQIIDANKLL